MLKRYKWAGVISAVVSVFIMQMVFVHGANAGAAAKKTIVSKTKPRPQKQKIKISGKNDEEGSKISGLIVNAFAKGDLNGAILAMREEKASPKILYLTRETGRILETSMAKKIPQDSVHKVYQNTAIAYHNLYLFLRHNGIEQSDYFNNAVKFYKKAKSRGTYLHKAECDVLQAALLAAGGDRVKAAKIFGKVDEAVLRGDFESMEYLAAYHAANGNIDEALKYLDAAHRLNPDETMTWLAIGDDFHKIEDDSRFKSLLVEWKAADAGKKLTLSTPQREKPRLEVTDDTGLFRPQKTMPHYKLKKR